MRELAGLHPPCPYFYTVFIYSIPLISLRDINTIYPYSYTVLPQTSLRETPTMPLFLYYFKSIGCTLYTVQCTVYTNYVFLLNYLKIHESNIIVIKIWLWQWWWLWSWWQAHKFTFVWACRPLFLSLCGLSNGCCADDWRFSSIGKWLIIIWL